MKDVMMEKPILVLCDPEEDYTVRMAGFLEAQNELPWKIMTFTDVSAVNHFDKHPSIIVMSESAAIEMDCNFEKICTVILGESGKKQAAADGYVDKYQPAEDVLRAILSIYSDYGGVSTFYTTKGGQTKYIGVYSPIHRCQQTTFALTLAQILSEKYHVLYLNFEAYVGVEEIKPYMQDRDLADLLYFLAADQERFSIKFQVIRKKIGEMDYIPPMKSSQNMLSVTAFDWIHLFQKIEEVGEYDYIVMDLSESMQGLFDILRMCTCIYTIIRNEKVSLIKQDQYEQLLKAYEFDDVLKKTDKCLLPRFYKIPENLGMYGRGEMADYVKECIENLKKRGLM